MVAWSLLVLCYGAGCEGGMEFGRLRGMDSDFSDELPYSASIRVLGWVAGALMALGVVSGLVMLIMKWASGEAPEILSQIPLVSMPLAFVALMLVMFLSLLRRRAS